MLCFLVSNELFILPILEDILGTPISSQNMVTRFGAAKSVKNVMDASPCFDLGMIVILDQCHKKLILYSGDINVCGVHYSYM